MSAPPNSKILIVEDQLIVAADLASRLRRLGYNIVGQTDHANDAVRLSEELTPDLVLMDIRLQGDSDGIAAAEEIRCKFRIPVVYLTAHTDEETLSRAKVTQPFGYLLKPFEERELRTVVEIALYKAEAERRYAEAEQRHREELLQAQKMETVGRLAGGVAHDFNNLLTVINCYCSVLLLGLEPSSQWRSSVEEIVKASDRAAELTRQLLAFGRRQMLQPKVLDLNRVVTGSVSLFQRLLAENIRFQSMLYPSQLATKADLGQLEQVILNLVLNACDAMPNGGQLELSTTMGSNPPNELPHLPGGTYVALTISDNGRGMDEATQAKIWEPFFTTKAEGVGAGFGLASVYGIVKQSGGHIHVKSKLGEGAAFTVTLPWSDETPVDDLSQVDTSLARGSETILLVEDELTVRTLTAHILRSAGYTLIEAHSGEEALKILEATASNIDLLITDIIMPGMSGTALASAMKAKYPQMKILLITGYAGYAGTLAESLTKQMDLLTKPFTSSILTQKVRSLLDNRTCHSSR